MWRTVAALSVVGAAQLIQLWAFVATVANLRLNRWITDQSMKTKKEAASEWLQKLAGATYTWLSLTATPMDRAVVAFRDQFLKELAVTVAPKTQTPPAGAKKEKVDSLAELQGMIAAQGAQVPMPTPAPAKKVEDVVQPEQTPEEEDEEGFVL